MSHSPAVEFLNIVVRVPALSYRHSRHEYFYIYFCLSNSFMTSSHSKLIKNVNFLILKIHLERLHVYVHTGLQNL